MLGRGEFIELTCGHGSNRLIPSENEFTDEHYNSLLQESEALAEQVEEGVEERLYTRGGT